MRASRYLITIALLVLTHPAWADASTGTVETEAESVQAAPSTPSGASGVSWQGWGVRFGLTSDADQVVGGVHFNLGDLADNLRFQPDLQLGTGDDATTLYGTVPLYYRFATETTFTPYAGGGVSLGYVDVDAPAQASGDDSSFEVGAKATGGLEWKQRSGNSFFVELSLGFGDVHDALIVAAWTF